MPIRVPITDHLGNHFDSITAMCRHHQIPVTLYRNRRARGYTIKQALRTIDRTVEYKGKVYKNLRQLALSLGLDYRRVFNRTLRHNLEFALNPVRLRGRPCTDHLGQTFPHSNAMAAYWGVPPEALRGRLRRGWGLERALTAPVRPCRRVSAAVTRVNI